PQAPGGGQREGATGAALADEDRGDRDRQLRQHQQQLADGGADGGPLGGRVAGRAGGVDEREQAGAPALGQPRDPGGGPEAGRGGRRPVLGQVGARAAGPQADPGQQATAGPAGPVAAELGGEREV